jgi:hypothetical protein
MCAGLGWCSGKGGRGGEEQGLEPGGGGVLRDISRHVISKYIDMTTEAVLAEDPMLRSLAREVHIT